MFWSRTVVKADSVEAEASHHEAFRDADLVRCLEAILDGDFEARPVGKDVVSATLAAEPSAPK